MENINVKNREGIRELFSAEKIYLSAINSGADINLAKEISEEIEKKIYPDIETSKIFYEVKRLLQQKNLKASLRFDLKSAMKRLGPTGYPFEKYIKSIFENIGFKTKINVYLKGRCITHEVDFWAEKNNKIYIGECKYRNIVNNVVGTNIALSNYARFLDLKEGSFLKKFPNSKIESILVTNAKFTDQAIKYSRCVRVKLLGWKSPKNSGLEKIIETNKLYPITILPSLSPKIANIFTTEEKMLAKNILEINLKDFSKRKNISLNKLKRLKEEAEILLK